MACWLNRYLNSLHEVSMNCTRGLDVLPHPLGIHRAYISSVPTLERVERNCYMLQSNRHSKNIPNMIDIGILQLFVTIAMFKAYLKLPSQ